MKNSTSNSTPVHYFLDDKWTPTAHFGGINIWDNAIKWFVFLSPESEKEVQFLKKWPRSQVQKRIASVLTAAGINVD